MDRELTKVWVTWELQTRNQSMSGLVGAKLYELISKRKGILRYIILTARTVSVIREEGPDILICQNPSIVLSFLALILRPLFKFRLVVDAHNAGVYPLEGTSLILQRIAKLIVKRADLVIVTNHPLKRICESWGGQVISVPDPVPDLGFNCQNASSAEYNTIFFNPITFLFICSWSDDEPVKEVIEAAKNCPAVNLRITGKYPAHFLDGLPSNVELLGFLPRSAYLSELRMCEAVLVLTRRENCLNCGAYEAVSAGKPGILSNTKVIREYFDRGFLYTSNETNDIEDKFLMFTKSYSSLAKDVTQLRGLLKEKDKVTQEKIKSLLSKLVE